MIPRLKEKYNLEISGEIQKELNLNNVNQIPKLEKIVKPILHSLWNLGLRVGYATRNISECILYSRKKIDVCTSILESRFLIGNKIIYRNLFWLDCNCFINCIIFCNNVTRDFSIIISRIFSNTFYQYS